MIFIPTIIITIAAFFVWRSASSKMQQKNIPFRSMVRVSALVEGVFGVLALLQCFTQIPDYYTSPAVMENEAERVKSMQRRGGL